MPDAAWLLKAVHYPAVQFGGLFHVRPDLWAVYAVLGALLAAIAVIDARSGLIPLWLTVPGIAAGLALVAAFRYIAPVDAVVACVGIVVVLQVAIARHRRSGRPEPVGHGAVMMAGLVGAFLGLPGLLVALAVAAVSALAFALAAGLRKPGQTVEIGPWLALGAAVAALTKL